MRTVLAAVVAVSIPTSVALSNSTPIGRTPARPAASVSRPEVKRPAAALDDATIIAIFDAANTRDIETGELAAKRAQNSKVRDLGVMFARDHRNVRQHGRDLAKKLGITPTPPARDPDAQAHAKALKMLRSKPSSEFDQAFLRHEINYHGAVIDAVTQTLLPAIKNPELKALVEKVAPAFQAHQQAAQHLEQEISE